MATKTKTTEAKTGAFNGLNGQPYEAILFSSKEQLEKAMKASAEAFEKAFSMSKDRFDVLTKSVDDAAKLGKEQVDALVSASNVAAKGIETINAEVMAFTKHQIEDQISATKAMMGAKTLQELYDLQNDYLKSSLDAVMQQSTKLGELTTKLAKESFEPLNERFQQSFDKLLRPVAA